MKLIFVTRRVDKEDPRAGFVHDWLNEFAKQIADTHRSGAYSDTQIHPEEAPSALYGAGAEQDQRLSATPRSGNNLRGSAGKLYVICLERGDTSGLANNITVESMGKELGKNKLSKLFAYIKLLGQWLPKSDGVFVHMHPVYAIIAAPLAKIYKKPIVFWYTHKQVDFKLRLATWLVDRVVSASPESFRLKTNKVKFLGHGINIQKFKNQKSKIKITNQNYKILTVGRISPVKRLDLLIEALSILKREHPNFDFEATIAGGPGLPEHEKLVEDLKRRASESGLEDRTHFLGPVSYEKIPELYGTHDIFVNLSETGSLDKAVLEAAASGCLVLTSNEAFKSVLPAYAQVAANAAAIADKVWQLSNLSEIIREQYCSALRNIVEQNHSLNGLVKKLMDEFQKLYAAA